MKIELVEIDTVKPYSKNPRKNAKAVSEVMKSLRQFGFQQPLVVDQDNVLIVGHTRWEAAKRLGYKKVPIKGPEKDDGTPMTEAEIKAYRIMDNRTSEFADWDRDLLLQELESIENLTKDLEVKLDHKFIGFEIKEIDEPVNEENWKFNDVKDESIMTIRCRLDQQGEIKKRLQDMELNIEVSNVRRY